MAQVITFEDYTPVARYDDLPWTDVRIEEAPAAAGPWTEIDTLDIDPVDVDPSNPATRSFTTELASDDPDLWYRLVFLDGTGDFAQYTTPVQNIAGATTAYTTVSELQRVLKINNPTALQTAAMNRVLLAAAGEIDSEISRPSDADALVGAELALAAEVNLERAVEHWQQAYAPFGLLGLGNDFGGVHTATNSWNRHAEKLATLKLGWGIA